jgi:hypothetical protein
MNCHILDKARNLLVVVEREQEVGAKRKGGREEERDWLTWSKEVM